MALDQSWVSRERRRKAGEVSLQISTSAYVCTLAQLSSTCSHFTQTYISGNKKKKKEADYIFIHLRSWPVQHFWEDEEKACIAIKKPTLAKKTFEGKVVGQRCMNYEMQMLWIRKYSAMNLGSNSILITENWGGCPCGEQNDPCYTMNFTGKNLNTLGIHKKWWLKKFR